MSMLSFYGGPAGKDFTIAKTFKSKVDLDADIAAGDASEVYAEDYVLISYGDPNTTEFAENRQKDGDKSYNATLWKKRWNNGYVYDLICDLTVDYPLFVAGSLDSTLPFGSAPQLIVDSSTISSPKISLKLPASLKEGKENSATSVSPLTAPAITPSYGGTLKNELSFKLQIPQGVTFTPSVSDDGEISWINDGNLANPPAKIIKGQKGDTGTSFTGIEYTPTSESGGNNTFKLKFSDGTVGSESYNIRNGIDIVKVSETPSSEDGGTNSITFIKSDNSQVGPIFLKNGNKGSTGTFKSVTATVDAAVGTPRVTATLSGDKSNADLLLEFKNLKGQPGEGGTVEITSVTVDNSSSETSAPSVDLVSGTTNPQNAKYSLAFHNLVGKRGPTGPRGYYFTPSVASNGDLSWSNDGGLANPATVSIRGPQGEIGNPLNVIANELVSSEQVPEDTLGAVGAELTVRGRDPQAGELIAVTYSKSDNDNISYWYFKSEGEWGRVQLSGGVGNLIVNNKTTGEVANTKAYSATYVNALEERLAVLEAALEIGHMKGGNS